MNPGLRRVLIADRDVRVRQQLYGGLLESNVFSDCVGSTADALAKMELERYGVIVVDVLLPGELPEVLALIQRLPVRERPVVLALAANPETARTLDVDIVQIVLRRPIYVRQVVDLILSCLRSVASRSSGSSETRTESSSSDIVTR